MENKIEPLNMKIKAQYVNTPPMDWFSDPPKLTMYYTKSAFWILLTQFWLSDYFEEDFFLQTMMMPWLRTMKVSLVRTTNAP